MKQAVVLFGHGTVDDLADLPQFVTNIRRGHAPPPELIAELMGRYEAIGGRSPFNDIARALATSVEAQVGLPTVIAMRLWHPNAKEVLADLAKRGVERVVFIPLAQHSGPVYAEAAERAQKELADEGVAIDVVSSGNWGQTPALLDAYAEGVRAALDRLPEGLRAQTTTIFSAHSLPKMIIDAGDAFEAEFRASVEGVLSRLAAAGVAVRPMLSFQSQGAQTPGARPVEWLGPALPEVLDAVRARGDRHVLFAPTGFLADHVEVLYDLDIEAAGFAKDRGLSWSRTESLNAGPALVAVVTDLAKRLLEDPSP